MPISPNCAPLHPGHTGGPQTDGTLQAEPPGAVRPPSARAEAEVSPEGVHKEENESHRLLQYLQWLLLVA